MPHAQKACFQNLPMELHWNILENVSDVRALASTALTCRALYSAFKAKDADLPTDVLINTIGYSVLPEAVFAYQCSPPFLSVPVHSTIYKHNWLDPDQTRAAHNYAKEFIRHIKQRNVPTFIKWGMDEALLLSDFHQDVVVPLTQRFIRSAAAEPISLPGKDLDESLQERPATRLEKERIARTLYRFEICRKLFGRYVDGIDHMTNDDAPVPHSQCFFKRLAPWEIVQLATIHDFLANQVIPALGDIAEHDIEWAAGAIDDYTPWSRRIDHPAVQHLLTLGLQEILKIASCDSFKSRLRVLGRGATITIENNLFLERALRMSDDFDPARNGRRLLHGRPYHDDGDAGAQVMWRAGLSDLRYPFYDARDWLDRRWGHVVWDRARCEELGVLGRPWSRAWAVERGIPDAVFERSLRQRVKLWDEGGRGYWSEHDRSRVVYPEGRHKLPVATASTAEDRTESWVMAIPDESESGLITRVSWYSRLSRKLLGR
ncbi:hypothetical protein GGR53DRAFT_466462 [Hypoxylon sp. FL1150]|nr:hypothetical protein GGR53DRAFT_466462 [Hypoxylon sp. FL1150]